MLRGSGHTLDEATRRIGRRFVDLLVRERRGVHPHVMVLVIQRFIKSYMRLLHHLSPGEVNPRPVDLQPNVLPGVIETYAFL